MSAISLDLGPIQNHAYALAKGGDYASAGIILQLVQFLIEKDAKIAELTSKPAAVPDPTETLGAAAAAEAEASPEP